jgi:hypothetical protein
VCDDVVDETGDGLNLLDQFGEFLGLFVAQDSKSLVGAVCVEMVQGAKWVEAMAGNDVRVAERASFHGGREEGAGVEYGGVMEEIVSEVICLTLGEEADVIGGSVVEDGGKGW